jgi:hypothetical protein
MSAAEKQLAALRALRDAARADVLARVEAVKPLTKPKALGLRVMGDAKQYGRDAVAQAMEIAADNRGVLAGTLTALLLWAARKQVLQKAVSLAPQAQDLAKKAGAGLRKLAGEKLGGGD